MNAYILPFRVLWKNTPGIKNLGNIFWSPSFLEFLDVSILHQENRPFMCMRKKKSYKQKYDMIHLNLRIWSLRILILKMFLQSQAKYFTGQNGEWTLNKNIQCYATSNIQRNKLVYIRKLPKHRGHQYLFFKLTNFSNWKS